MNNVETNVKVSIVVVVVFRFCFVVVAFRTRNGDIINTYIYNMDISCEYHVGYRI